MEYWKPLAEDVSPGYVGAFISSSIIIKLWKDFHTDVSSGCICLTKNFTIKEFFIEIIFKENG